MKTYKYPLHIVLAICMVVCMHTIQMQGASINYKFEYNLENVKVNSLANYSEGMFDFLEIEGLRNLASDSEPLLPRESRIFRVPNNAMNFSVRIVSLGESKILSLNYPLCPMRDVKAGDNEKTASDNIEFGPSYQLNQIMPDAEIVDTFFLNGNEHYVNISISPACYNGPEQIVTIYSSIEIELTYSESNGIQRVSEMESVQTPRMFHFEDYVPATGSVTPELLSSQSESLPSTYIILVPENLQDAVTRLGEWKQQKGYNVIIHTVEDILKKPLYAIGSSSKCFDKESSVREWLKQVYSTYGAFYCLIVGDYRTSAPIRKFKGCRNDLSNPNDNEYLPTDAYFCDLVSDWSFTKDSSGLYSSYYGVSSFSPTVSIGRLLASEKEEIENFIDKVILYELYPGLGDSAYLTRGFIGRHHDSISSNSNNENLFNNLTGFNLTQIDAKTAEKLVDVTPNSIDVLECLKNVGLGTLQYHGSPISLTLSQAQSDWPNAHYIMALKDYRHVHNDTFLGDSQNGMDYINNRFSPSIMYSLACTLAPFDERFYDQFPGLADIQTKSHTLSGIFTVAKDFGGPVFLANTREGYFRSSAAMEREFGKYIEMGYSVGEAENLSKIWSTNNHIRLVHSIIGDPEIKIWIRNPNFLNSQIRFVDKNILIGSSFLEDVTLGISLGEYNDRQLYSSLNGGFIISLKDIILRYGVKDLVSIYLSQKEIWPETFLIPVSEKVMNTSKSYYVSRFVIGGNGKFCNCPVLKLASNSNVSIFSYTNINSSSGIDVQEKGSLILDAFEKITLEGDTVQEGGQLKLTANSVELGKGCQISSGGTLTIKNPKK